MPYPKQLNAFSITKVLGKSPLEADVSGVKKRLKRYFGGRGPYSHDFYRKNSFALVSRQKSLRALIEECMSVGQPIGRAPNVALMQHTLKQYEKRSYRTFPVRAAIREIKDGLIARVFCTLYTVEGGLFTFEVFQTSLTAEFSKSQYEFVASLYCEALLKDDYALGRVRIWDFSWNSDKSDRLSDQHIYSAANRISKDEIDRVLTVYGRAYDELLAEGLPKEVFQPSDTFEDRQYDFWRG